MKSDRELFSPKVRSYETMASRRGLRWERVLDCNRLLVRALKRRGGDVAVEDVCCCRSCCCIKVIVVDDGEEAGKEGKEPLLIAFRRPLSHHSFVTLPEVRVGLVDSDPLA